MDAERWLLWLMSLFEDHTMRGFELILGHLLGDYILQNDWMAANKSNPGAGKRPDWKIDEMNGHPLSIKRMRADLAEVLAKLEATRRAWHVGNLACLVHCILYTAGVWMACREWFPTWGYAAVFLAHFPIDRWKFAAWWMTHVSGQARFASKEHPMFPWSIVVVDNIFHLLTLWAIVKLDAVLPWLQACLLWSRT